MVTVVSYNLKKRRFHDLHRAALRFPVARFKFVGNEVPPQAKGAQEGEVRRLLRGGRRRLRPARLPRLHRAACCWAARVPPLRPGPWRRSRVTCTGAAATCCRKSCGATLSPWARRTRRAAPRSKACWRTAGRASTRASCPGPDAGRCCRWHRCTPSTPLHSLGTAREKRQGRSVQHARKPLTGARQQRQRSLSVLPAGHAHRGQAVSAYRLVNTQPTRAHAAAAPCTRRSTTQSHKPPRERAGLPAAAAGAEAALPLSAPAACLHTKPQPVGLRRPRSQRPPRHEHPIIRGGKGGERFLTHTQWRCSRSHRGSARERRATRARSDTGRRRGGGAPH